MFSAGSCLLSGGPASLGSGGLCGGEGRCSLDALHPCKLPLPLLLFPRRLAQTEVTPARRHGLRLHNVQQWANQL